ncbi:MAG: CCA tRNA nucleotidyltransferase [Candidatus Kerfeldbacteria bacterium]|nr:CCA tRNA nucleotidyltransferase [Candidatus Kerfeldbacteria bacterium]
MHSLAALTRNTQLTFLAAFRRDFPHAEIFVVGGIVRDALIGRSSKDYDLVIRNVPAKKLHAWLQRHGHVDLVGRSFGVFKFLPKGNTLTEPIDIALPRTEHAWGTGGYRDVEIQSNPILPIEDDLARRDFTINALAYDVITKTLIDPYNGQPDIQKKIIRTVGAPSKRFGEDYSRLLRGLRFSAQLGFTIEPKTWRALKTSMRHINKKLNGEYVVPRETIASEMKKTFVSIPAIAFDLYDQSGAIKELMPELLPMKRCPQPKQFHSEGDVWKHTRLCLSNLMAPAFSKKFPGTPLTAELVFAVLWHDIGKPATLKRSDRLRFNNHDIVGARMARAIMDRLRLSSAGVNTAHIEWLISRHMIVASTKYSPMKKTTIEKYFYHEQNPGEQLRKLSYVDILSTLAARTGKPNLTDYRALERQIMSIKPRRGNRLAPDLLSGNDIMRALHLRPGPRIGKIKSKLREAQLRGTIKTKSQARAYLTKLS